MFTAVSYAAHFTHMCTICNMYTTLGQAALFTGKPGIIGSKHLSRPIFYMGFPIAAGATQLAGFEVCQGKCCGCPPYIWSASTFGRSPTAIKTLWLPYVVCLAAPPINPFNSLTMLNKNYKNTYFLAFL